MDPVKVTRDIYLKLLTLAVGTGVLLRLLLVISPITDASTLSFWQWPAMILLGALNDACVFSILFIPLWLFLLSSGHRKYERWHGWAWLGVLAAGWVFVTFLWSELREFNVGLRTAVSALVAWWIAAFAFRMFVPGARRGWMRFWTATLIGVYLFVMALNFFGEFFFWKEFGVRYNFIAVDYLVYTQEVVGNIFQSYSMGAVLTVCVLFAVVCEATMFRLDIRYSTELHRRGWRPMTLQIGLIPALTGVFLLLATQKTRETSNVWYNELQASGPYSFFRAFFKHQLDYDKFYVTNDPQTVYAELREAMALNERADTVAPHRPNVVVVMLESMSASYMERYGGSKHLTPTLDSLATKSLVFDNLFATGNRTVRGLEAITLSRPPSPGESIVKRSSGAKAYPSVADNFNRMGYTKLFFYGGDSYFDNMETFFNGEGFKIVDRKTMKPGDITCETVWGVCDEDIYSRVMNRLDSADAAGTGPIYAHVLTTSNHRPYIYPEGTVSISPETQSRDGAVMYSDHALGRFLHEASRKRWFDNTVFIIVADHCASSAGSTELPPSNYHIPAMIYGPSLIEPRAVETVASQIDLIPTLCAILHWTPDKRLFGRNILAPDYKSRAFVATYQDLGYIRNDTLTVLSPGRKVRQYKIERTAADPYALRPVETVSEGHLRRASSIYQRSSVTMLQQ